MEIRRKRSNNNTKNDKYIYGGESIRKNKKSVRVTNLFQTIHTMTSTKCRATTMHTDERLYIHMYIAHVRLWSISAHLLYRVDHIYVCKK